MSGDTPSQESARSPGYASEKLSKALYSLVSRHDLRTRLTSAFVTLSAVDPMDFPISGEHGSGDLRARYRGIKDAVTAKGSYEDSIASLTDDEAEKIAEELLQLENAMHHYFWR
jgi:hypothetical protein